MSKKGIVYLMRASDRYKIGTTARLEPRRVQIERMIKAPVEIVHVVQSVRRIPLERALHRRFAAKSVAPEWYDLDEADVALICSLARCDSVESLPAGLCPAPIPTACDEDEDEPHPFAASLRRLREARAMTRYRLAKSAGVSQITLTRMEQGERTATVPTLCRLADALDCTLDELCGRTKENGR